MLLLKAAGFISGCFYVTFYFSIVFLFFIRILLQNIAIALVSGLPIYFITLVAVVSLYAFNNVSASVAKFLAYSSAVNGAMVLVICSSVLFVI